MRNPVQADFTQETRHVERGMYPDRKRDEHVGEAHEPALEGVACDPG